MILVNMRWFLLLFPWWGDLPLDPQAEPTPKLTHGRLIRWYTSGFC